MTYTMISSRRSYRFGIFARDLWTARLPESLRERGPHVEDRGEKGEYWVCDGETWAEYRGERWFANPTGPGWLWIGAESVRRTGLPRPRNGSPIWIATASKLRSCFRRLSPCRSANPS